jgi:NDP-sugar pyrophosphorylase family protein
MQILLPLAGPSQFFKPEDYPFPKPLIEVGGELMIARVVENLRKISADQRFLFVVLKNDVVRFSLDSTLKIVAGDCTVVPLARETRGALCSVLMAIDQIDEDQPLIICNGDQVIDADISAIVDSFLAKQADAGVITFQTAHPRWSYVRVDSANCVLEAAEKRVISRNGIAGFYFFKRAGLFIDAAMRCITSESNVDGNYFISPALNELVLDGRRVLAHMLPEQTYHSFYSPAKIQEFEETRLIQSMGRDFGTRDVDSVRVVIPAAGEGSRFRNAGFSVPKPFIDVLGRPMIEYVLDNVTPRRATRHLLLRKEHMESAPDTIKRLTAREGKVHPVDALTEGTACTLLLARSEFDDDKPLLVANSDQIVDFSVDDFVDDCLARNLDGSILVFRDPARDPKWSFARVNATGMVAEVVEKRPISDLATVGIYFFRRGADFVKAAIDMIARNDRVNNEFYTCPVYNYMIARGQRIGIFEVPQTAMHGLGTPEDLATFLAQRRN